MYRLLSSLVLFALLFAGVAFADDIQYIPPKAPWNGVPPESEANLHQIYNIIYGTSVSNDDLAGLWSGWEVFDPAAFGPDVKGLQVDVMFRNAFMDSVFGYYATSQPNALGMLFSVPGITFDNPSSSDLRGVYASQILDVSAPVGFYQTPFLAGQAIYWAPYYSESMRNYRQGNPYDPFDPEWPRMAYERHLLVLNTPDPDTFLLAIEDLPYFHKSSHQDYNDLVIQLRILRDTPEVPEPATLTLMGMGLAGIAVLRMKKKTV